MGRLFELPSSTTKTAAVNDARFKIRNLFCCRPPLTSEALPESRNHKPPDKVNSTLGSNQSAALIAATVPHFFLGSKASE
jgi:hypothetical protein